MTDPETPVGAVLLAFVLVVMVAYFTAVGAYRMTGWVLTLLVAYGLGYEAIRFLGSAYFMAGGLGD